MRRALLQRHRVLNIWWRKTLPQGGRVQQSRCPRPLSAQSSTAERQSITSKSECNNQRALDVWMRRATLGAPDIWGRRALLQRGRVQQRKSPRHWEMQSFTTERPTITNKEPQTFGGAEIYYREARYNNQGAPDIWVRTAPLQTGRIQQSRSPRHVGSQSLKRH